jgi:hypothetical protein
MTPAPLTHCLPKLAAQIDNDRPLIAAALLDIRVLEIKDDAVIADVITQHSYDILTTQSQRSYINAALTQHFGHESHFSLALNLTPAEDPPLSQPPVDGGSATPKPPRHSNSLTYAERSKLQAWMDMPENTQFVANNSDALAAGKATGELQMDITAGNIAGMRKVLGIDKTKPAKTEPAHDIDLVALHALVQEHHLQLEPLKNNTLAGILSGLRNSIHAIEQQIATISNGPNGRNTATIPPRDDPAELPGQSIPPPPTVTTSIEERDSTKAA